VIAMIARAVAVPGRRRTPARRLLTIAPLVACSAAAGRETAECEANQTSTSPGSTIRAMRASVNANRVVGTVNVRRADAPASSSTRA